MEGSQSRGLFVPNKERTESMGKHTTSHRGGDGNYRRTTTTSYKDGSSKSVTRRGPFSLVSNGRVESVTRRDSKGNSRTDRY